MMVHFYQKSIDMIPKYLFTPITNFTEPLPVNTAVVLKEKSVSDSEKRFEKIVNDITQAFQFADNAGNHYNSGNRE